MPEQQATGPSRAPLWVATAGAVLWLLLLFLLVLRGLPAPSDQATLAAMVREWIGPALLPVATLFAVAAAWMAASRPAGAWPPVPAEDPLLGAEADLTGSIARVDTLRRLLAEDVAALNTAVGSLRGAKESVATEVAALRAEAEAAAGAGDALAARMAALSDEAETVGTAMTTVAETLAGRIGALEAQVAAIGAAFTEAAGQGASASTAVEGALADLEARMAQSRTVAAALVSDLNLHAARSHDTNVKAMAAMEQALGAQLAQMAAAVSEAEASLARIGGEQQQRLGALLAELTANAAALEERLQAQIAASAELGETAERSFQRLDARLDLSMRASGDAVDKLAARVAAVNAETDRVAEPLRQGREAVLALEQAVGTLRETLLQTIDVMGQTLPVRTVEASRAAETLSGELNALVAAIDAASARAGELATPIAQSRAVIEAATGAFAEQRAAMETAGQALVVELEQARQLIAEVEDQTRDTSLAAATRLVDAMTRVREIASQAAGTMKETLDGVIAEARDSLAQAADEAMRRGFAAPIAAQAREAEEAAAAASEVARSAAERAAASLLALATTVKQVEARAEQSRESLEELVQRDLAASTRLLTDHMAASAGAIAAALGKPMTDAEIQAWRQGERSIFGKRTVALLDRAGKRALAERLAADPEFAQLARRHVADFEALVARVGGDSPLARALAQSDSGRIAMLLAEAMED